MSTIKIHTKFREPSFCLLFRAKKRLPHRDSLIFKGFRKNLKTCPILQKKHSHNQKSALPLTIWMRAYYHRSLHCHQTSATWHHTPVPSGKRPCWRWSVRCSNIPQWFYRWEGFSNTRPGDTLFGCVLHGSFDMTGSKIMILRPVVYNIVITQVSIYISS